MCLFFTSQYNFLLKAKRNRGLIKVTLQSVEAHSLPSVFREEDWTHVFIVAVVVSGNLITLEFYCLSLWCIGIISANIKNKSEGTGLFPCHHRQHTSGDFELKYLWLSKIASYIFLEKQAKEFGRCFLSGSQHSRNFTIDCFLAW